MPWSSRTREQNARYWNAEHRALRKAYAEQLARDGFLICQQDDGSGVPGSGCVMPSRIILPGMRWNLGHDATGTRYIGPVCAKCNHRDASVRGNRGRKPKRWVM